MTDYDIPPVQQDYRQLYEGPEPSQLAQLQQTRPAQLTLPGIELNSTPATPQRPTITIDPWPVQPTPAASEPPGNAPNGVSDNASSDEPEATEVSGFCFNWLKWSLVAALILAGCIYYL